MRDAIQKATEKHAVNSVSGFLWGEVEMPEALCKKMEKEFKDNKKQDVR